MRLMGFRVRCTRLGQARRSSRLLWCLTTAAFFFASPTPIGGQGEPRLFDALRTTIPALSTLQIGGVREVTIRWTAYAGPATELLPATSRQPINRLIAVDEHSTASLLPRQRAPRLSEGQLVVVAVDAVGGELGWSLIRDPRIVRAELPGPTGELSGQVFHQAEVEFLVSLPDREEIAAVNIFQPIWTGSGFVLQSLGTCDLGR